MNELEYEELTTLSPNRGINAVRPCPNVRAIQAVIKEQDA